jgi:hypothetical protein
MRSTTRASLRVEFVLDATGYKSSIDGPRLMMIHSRVLFHSEHANPIRFLTFDIQQLTTIFYILSSKQKSDNTSLSQLILSSN